MKEELLAALHDLETSAGLYACDNEEGQSLFQLQHNSIPALRELVNRDKLEPARESILCELHSLLDCVSADDHLTVSGLDEFDRDSLSTLGAVLYDVLDRLDQRNGEIENTASDWKKVCRELEKAEKVARDNYRTLTGEKIL